MQKQEFLKSIEGNLRDALNKQSILKEYDNIFDIIDIHHYKITYVPIFHDNRFYEIKDKENRLLGQIFCSKSQSVVYFFNQDSELKVSFNEAKDDYDRDCTVKQIKYNILNKIDESDPVMVECLDRLDSDLRPMFHLEINGSKYYASQVIETKETILNDKYINVEASLYDYEYDMYDCDYKSFNACCNNDKIKLSSADSLNGYAAAVKIGDMVPQIKMDSNANSFIKFNFEEFVDNFLKSKELNPDSYDEYKVENFKYEEQIGADIYNPIN